MSLLSRVYTYLSRLATYASISVLRSYFTSNSLFLGELLSEYGFHKPMCEHPCLLYGVSYGHVSRFPKWVVRVLVRIIYAGVSKESFNCPKVNERLFKIGINSFYARYVNNFLERTSFSRGEYIIPSAEIQHGRILIYTVNIGGYDAPRELLYKSPKADYYYFTDDKNCKSSTWNVVYVENEGDNVLLSRDIKIRPHKWLPKKYDISIYVDANATIYGDLSDMSAFLCDDVSFALTKHSARQSVLEEIDACVAFLGIDRKKAMDQYQRYLDWGFKDDKGLAECTILVRKHNDATVMRLMEEWWNEFKDGVHRDQISLLPCVCHQSFKGLSIEDGCVWNNQYCIIGGHMPASIRRKG